MKLFSTLLVLVIVASSLQSLTAGEPAIIKNTNTYYKTQTLEESLNLKGKYQYPTTQNIDYFILDSLANAYSFYTNDQEPFVYHAETNTLVIIKRGPGIMGIGTDNPANPLNHLFLLTSNNWGVNWSSPQLIYDAVAQPYGFARYPSIYPFMFGQELVYLFSAPTTGGTGWEGYVNGLFVDGTPVPDKSTSFTQQGTSYQWSSTSTSLKAGVLNNGEPYGIVLSTPVPLLEFRDGANQSPLGFMRTEDYGSWSSFIPEALKSENFISADLTNPNWRDFRLSSIINMQTGADGTIYAAISGIFKSHANIGPRDFWAPAVTKSMDNGATWSELEVMQGSLIYDYAVQQGALLDSVFISNNYKFVLNSDGSYSFINSIFESNSFKAEEQQIRQIVEIYYANGNWGIRKISDNTGFVILYADEPAPGTARRNQLGAELQISRSVDGEYLLAKWVDLIDVAQPRDQLDVFVAARRVSDNIWGRVLNITNSPDEDRITWIPNLLPNDLKNIPLLRVASIPVAGENEQDAARRARTLEVPQYVLMGHFNADLSVSVIERDITDGFAITGIYPNPAKDVVDINIYNSQAYKAEINIFNVLGEKVMSFDGGFAGEGIQSFSLNISTLPIGAYYVSVSSNGNVTTKLMNIIR